MTTKKRQFASQFPESQVIEAVYAMGTGRAVYDQLKKLRDLITRRMAEIWSRKKQRSRGRKRSEKELAAREWRFAGFMAAREDITQQEAWERMQAKKRAKAAGTDVELTESSQEMAETGTDYTLANWQEAIKRPPGWGREELLRKSAAMAAQPQPAPYEEEDEEDGYRGTTCRTLKPGGKH